MPAPPENSSAAPLLTVTALGHRIGGREILAGLSFQATCGDVIALLGQNGAGKSSTLRALAGIFPPHAGEILIANRSKPHACPGLRAQVGYLPERPPIYPRYTVRRQLQFAGRLYGLKGKRLGAAVRRVVELCDLGGALERPLAKLSRGYRQRAALAQAVIHSPQLVLLDEPASGLDPVQLERLHALIGRLKEVAAVVYSTHVLSDALAVSNRLLVLHEGRQRFFGPPSELVMGSRKQLPDAELERALLRLMLEGRAP